MQEKKTPLRVKAVRLGAVVGVSAAAVLFTATPSWAAAETATVAPTFGPSGGGNSVTLSGPSPLVDGTNAFVQGTTAVVFAGAATCPTTYGTPTAGTIVAPADVRVVSTSKLAVTVPSGVTTANSLSGTTGTFSVCAYNGTASNTPLASASDGTPNPARNYTVGPTPTVTSITPATSPAQGGGTITIAGTNLANATVTVGGTSVTRTNLASNATSFVGTIPAKAAGGPYAVVVAVPNGGSLTRSAAFTYTNGVVSSPTTSPNTRVRTDLDVQGVGFSSMDFSTSNGVTPNDSNAHVYLVRGDYNPARSGTSKTTGQVTECLNVLAISDTNLVCSLYLNGVPLASTRNVTGTISGTTFTATSGSFTLADIGQTVSGVTGIQAGTVISSLIDGTKATLNKSASVSSATAITLAPSRSFTDATLTANSATITSTASAAFNAVDVGRTISGNNIPAGTTITAVTNATTATMSAPASGTATGSYVITNNPGPQVPNGTYTVTVVNNGSVDAQTSDAYVKSIITSGSTFTVADY
ncbi:IPT/TIG domain-containing protein [Actinoplanes sp. LDG1-06]|uniref:IPT/TIG domain-containing protein n=1 Tax=Paractinoplanes ovalisporus TaxID=2810368 RepID=A0ABS2APA6_9ACTN|nr:IPT/TIG domain-containing protein [Actinoplanes ovalisporus]MBM2621595.1 IPT/TIG domain-containing protein [Actinoplanes ovalisporus]